ncbi:MAG: 2-hydroxyacyl-CoA dehydratase family protein [Chlorobiales bacterium]|nr:2-hydroxyacyl-CoA dehydratase family protein [Chlorobiales bacterium]
MAIKTLEVIRKRLEERPAELKKLRENGQKVVGWTGYNVPEEIIHALGFIPIRIAIGGDDRLVEVGGRYASSKNCVFIREIVGAFSENEDPFIQQTDILAFDATCLQNFRAAEVIEYYFKKDVIVLGVPRNFYWEEGKEYFGKEADEFTRLLEERAGVSLDLAKLGESVALYNDIRKTLKSIYSFQAAKDNVISWVEVFDLIQAVDLLDKKEYLALLHQTLAELQELQHNPVIEVDGNDARIFISGSLIPRGDRKLINIITSVGGRIVGDDIWTGILPHLDLDIKEISPAGVALGYLNRTPHAALPYLDLESDRRLKKLHELLAEFKAQGVIYHTLRYCDPFTFKAKETKDVLAKSAIPVLEIHTEYAGSDYEALRTRLEAFVEMIKIKAESAAEVTV